MAETLSTRVTRLEEAMVRLAEAQVKLTNAQAYLAEVQAADQGEFRRMKEESLEREKRIDEMKAEALEREKRIDERIEKLVVAIAELIRRDGHGS